MRDCPVMHIIAKNTPEWLLKFQNNIYAKMLRIPLYLSVYTDAMYIIFVVHN
jgi:hypothetical protein